MMTRKHFVALAKALAEIENPTARRNAAEKVAVALALDNPRFDRARFFKAANV
jgi:hypothetical protein